MIERNIQVITEFMLIIYCLHMIKNRRVKLSVNMVVPFIINTIAVNLIDIYQISDIMLIIPYGVIGYYIVKEFHVSILVAVRMFLMMMIMVCLLQLVMYYPCKLFLHGVDNKVVVGIFSNLLSILFVILLKNLQRKRNVGELVNNESFKEYGMDSYLAICCLALLIALYCYRYNFSINDMICVVIIILLTVVFSLLWQWQKEKYDTKEKLLKQEMLETYNTAFYDMITEMRMRQHNFNNQLNAILGLHKTTSSFEELIAKQREYCDVVLKENKYYKILGSSDNPILAGFLYQKFLEADRKDIQVAYEISLERIANKEDIYELVEMIGILMDNAIESAEQQADDCKTIAITFITEDKGLHFSIRNRSDMIKNQEIERMFQAGYSTKGTGRGLGLPKVKETLLKRGSDICVENIIVDNETWLQFSFHYGDCIQTESSLSHRA